MRDPLIKAYGHVYPADAALEEALRAALADALPETDDIPLLERDGDMLRISFEGSYFPEDEAVAALRTAAGMPQGKLDVLDLENWRMTRHAFRDGVLHSSAAPLNNVLDYSGH